MRSAVVNWLTSCQYDSVNSFSFSVSLYTSVCSKIVKRKGAEQLANSWLPESTAPPLCRLARAARLDSQIKTQLVTNIRADSLNSVLFYLWSLYCLAHGCCPLRINWRAVSCPTLSLPSPRVSLLRGPVHFNYIYPRIGAHIHSSSPFNGQRQTDRERHTFRLKLAM